VTSAARRAPVLAGARRLPPCWGVHPAGGSGHDHPAGPGTWFPAPWPACRVRAMTPAGDQDPISPRGASSGSTAGGHPVPSAPPWQPDPADLQSRPPAPGGVKAWIRPPWQWPGDRRSSSSAPALERARRDPGEQAPRSGQGAWCSCGARRSSAHLPIRWRAGPATPCLTWWTRLLKLSECVSLTW